MNGHLNPSRGNVLVLQSVSNSERNLTSVSRVKLKPELQGSDPVSSPHSKAL